VSYAFADLSLCTSYMLATHHRVDNNLGIVPVDN
jgi:hypothetical protein